MKTEFKAFLQLTPEQKRILLQALDYKIDEQGFVLTATNRKVICPYTHHPVRLETASVLPGSTIIINTSLVTLSEYISDYLEPEDDLLV